MARAAKQSAPTAATPEWWGVAIGVAGLLGLAAVVAFAAAAVVKEEEG